MSIVRGAVARAPRAALGFFVTVLNIVVRSGYCFGGQLIGKGGVETPTAIDITGGSAVSLYGRHMFGKLYYGSLMKSRGARGVRQYLEGRKLSSSRFSFLMINIFAFLMFWVYLLF